MPTAIVIGSGPNGLAGAVTLARAGLDVVVHEEQPTIGGGTRSAELTLPGFVHDLCSAIHPLARLSPFFRGVDLQLDWVELDIQTAHPFDDGTAVVLHRDVAETARSLGTDERAYRRLFEPVVEHWAAVEPVLVGPYPPPPGRVLAMLRALGPRGAAYSARLALASARSVAEKTFSTPQGRALFAGNAAHSMLPLEMRPSGGFGYALMLLGHVYGWGFPRGGSQRIADGLLARLRDLGGEVRTSSPVDELPVADVVLADVMPGDLLRMAAGRFPARYARALERYRHGPAAFKLDWALDGPIPWRAEECRHAATVHLGGTLEEIAASESGPWTGRHAERPFVLLAQHSIFDDTRAPAGKHTAWAYCHVPNGSTEDMTERIEAQVERFAPGFRELVLARSVKSPADFEEGNRNLVGGDINGGAPDLAQLFFRPVRKPVPYRTPLKGVYLCSSATPPGGGVHGMCGYAAAEVALRDLRASNKMSSGAA
ncbi:MAG: NAD(P)/FAD-dependent oxidoreductase [Actinobacteria bacterium]|nr:NAD(P)/FAD-dependent oxidoreductase [Actinomycetota bacterium]